MQQGPYTQGARELDRKSVATIKERIAASTGADGGEAQMWIGKPGHGHVAAQNRLERLLEGGAAQTDKGEVLSSASDAAREAKSWKRELHSFTPRDVMHLVMSAKADCDLTAFESAARGFLHHEFAGHKFLFCIHTDKADEGRGHIHAHALITMKSELGQRIDPDRDDLDRYREVFAEKAQDQGLRIVATVSLHEASSQKYEAKDKAIVQVAETPRAERQGADEAYLATHEHVVEAARARIAQAAANPVQVPTNDEERLEIDQAIGAWLSVKTAEPGNDLADRALDRVLEAGLRYDMQDMPDPVKSVLEQSGIDLFRQTGGTGGTGGEGDDVAKTAARMRLDLQEANHAFSAMAASLDAEERQAFRQTSERLLMHMAIRTDLQVMKEAGATSITREEMEHIAGSYADELMPSDGASEAQKRPQEEPRGQVQAQQPEAATAEMPLEAHDPLHPEELKKLEALLESHADRGIEMALAAHDAEQERLAQATALAARQAIERERYDEASSLTTAGAGREVADRRAERDAAIARADAAAAAALRTAHELRLAKAEEALQAANAVYAPIYYASFPKVINSEGQTGEGAEASKPEDINDRLNRLQVELKIGFNSTEERVKAEQQMALIYQERDRLYDARSAVDIAEKAVEDARQALYGPSADTSAKDTEDAEEERIELLRGEQLRLMNYINTHGHTAAEHQAAMQQFVKVMEELGPEAMRQNLSQTGGHEDGHENATDAQAQRPRTDLEIMQQKIIDDVGYKEAYKQEDSQSEGQSMDD